MPPKASQTSDILDRSVWMQKKEVVTREKEKCMQKFGGEREEARGSQ